MLQCQILLIYLVHRCQNIGPTYWLLLEGMRKLRQIYFLGESKSQKACFFKYNKFSYANWFSAFYVFLAFHIAHHFSGHDLTLFSALLVYTYV